MTTTQSCAECGTRAEPGQSFCDACGAVLGWTDRAGARTAAGAPAASAGGSGERSGEGPAGDPGNAVATRPGGAAGGGDADSADSSGGPSSRPAATAVSSTSGTPADAGPGGDAFARRDGGAGPARTSRDLLDPATTTGGSEAATAASGDAPERAPAAPADADDRGESAVGATASPDAPDTVPSPAVTRPTLSVPVDETAPTEPVPTAGPAPAPGDPDGLTDRARQLLVPVSDPGPRPAASPSVAPVLPGRPAPQRPQVVRAPGEELGADGGVPCPWCATRNRPDRHYCARCAMPMAGEGHTPARLPWWRRLWGSGNRETPWAGDRPRLRRAFDRVLAWLGAAIVLTLLIVLAVNIPKGAQATRDHFSKRAPVAPDRITASRSYPGHKPPLAFDKLNNTWWGPGVSQTGQGQWIEARFDQPTRLLDLIITPGVSTHADQLSQSALPHRVEARVTRADGKTETRELTLDQGAGGQRRAFRVGEVTAVRFTIESAYQTSASKQVAIAEIEFFGPSHAN
ncbi:NADase-type glycan-binding domain-containing protein [Streptomyces sp. NPDC051636]|uniref:NADase-type glycan-binding domain-containing protein n=1 Tax=Streptomyces sp. NPDC051636 TaxID=3365663 RepID=UPI00379FDA24